MSGFFVRWTVLSTLLCVSGCSNVIPSIPEVVASNRWSGKPFQEAIIKWGEPHQVEEAENQMFTASWNVDSFSYTRIQPAGQTLEMTGYGPTLISHHREKRYDHACKLLITFDKDLIITKLRVWEALQGSCSNFIWGDNKP